MNKDFNYKKSLGQNFLIDENIIRKIINEINAEEGDILIEIGPGSGSLTKHLNKLKSKVFCFEIDTTLKEKLDKFQNENLTIIYEDFLKVDLKDFLKNKKYNKLTFIGNLPYYITTAIINKITKETDANEIIVMMQKEVANRFMAKPNTKDYSSISVFLQYNYDIKKVVDVSKECFFPKPKVDSTVIKLTKKQKPYVKNEETFYKLLKDAFNQKRKNLKNNLKNYNLENINKTLNKFQKDLTFRAEQLSLEEFIEISNEL